MTVLGLDPGNEKSALILWDGEQIQWMKLASNVEIRLDLLRFSSDPVLIGVPLVIEKIACMGMPVGETVLETCVWTGRFMESYGVQRCFRITRGEIKMHLCGSMRARDANIRQRLIDRFGPAKKGYRLAGIKQDLWSALAVSTTWIDKNA